MVVEVKILILGSNDYKTSTAYQRLGLPPSILVDRVDCSYLVGHTSRQEFNSDHDLETIMKEADEIYWAWPDPKEFSDDIVFFDFMWWLRCYQEKYGNIKNFSEIKFDPYNWEIKLPKIDETSSIFLGCSFTAGAGLPNSQSRWANQVASYYGKNCVNLAESGSSNARSFEIFTRLPLIEDQIVVWQLTEPARLRYCDDKGVREIQLSQNGSRRMLDVYNDQYLLHDLLTKIEACVKISRLAKIKFVFWLVDYKKEFGPYNHLDLSYFYKYPEFIPPYLIQDYLVDTGTDNLHPGPQSNELISRAVIKHLGNLYN